MSTQFTTSDLEHLATLSRLSLKDDDKIKLGEQMSAIIGYIGEINSLDIKGDPNTDKTHINVKLRTHQ